MVAIWKYLDFTLAPGYRLARNSLYLLVCPDNLRDISQKPACVFPHLLKIQMFVVRRLRLYRIAGRH